VTIFNVSLEITSATLSIDELTAIAGMSPTDFHAKGDPVSPMPGAKVRVLNFWSLDSGVDHDTRDLAPHWPVLRPVLEELASIERRSDIEVSLSIGVTAYGTGFAFDLVPADVALLARAGCGIWTDTYNADEFDQAHSADDD
jgi:hypothetical protein